MRKILCYLLAMGLDSISMASGAEEGAMETCASVCQPDAIKIHNHLSLLLQAMEAGIITVDLVEPDAVTGIVCLDPVTCKMRKEEAVRLIEACVLGATGAGAGVKGFHAVFGPYYMGELIKLRALLAGFGMSIPGVNAFMLSVAGLGCAGGAVKLQAIIDKEIYECEKTHRNDQAQQLKLLKSELKSRDL